MRRRAGALLLAGLAACAGDKDAAPACEESLYYADIDGDGHGAGEATAACAPPAGFVAAADDCDDVDPEVRPGAVEVCDGEDDDCDGVIDEDALPDTAGYPAWLPDADGDGFGAGAAVASCAAPEGYVAAGGDCDDAEPTVFPGADERPQDGVDQDCDGADAETDATAPAPGDQRLSSPADVEALCAAYDAVDGDLIIDAGVGPAVTLPCLREVRGDLLLLAPELEALELGALWGVGGDLRGLGVGALALEAPALRLVGGALSLPLELNGALDALVDVGGDLEVGLDAPALTGVGGDLRAVGAAPALVRVEGRLVPRPELEALELGALRTIGGELRVDGDAALEVLALPALEAVGGRLELEGPALAAVELDALIVVDADLVVACPTCAGFSLPALREVGGGAWLGPLGGDRLELPVLATVGGALVVADAPALAALELGALQAAAEVELARLPALEALALPLLDVVAGPVRLDGLPALGALDLSGLRLAEPGAGLWIRGLDALPALRLPNVGEARGALDVEAGPALATVELPLVATLGALRLVGAPTALDASALGFVERDLELVLDGAGTLRLDKLRRVDGDAALTLGAAAAAPDLSALEAVGGDLSLRSASAAALALPALAAVDGALTAAPGPAVALALPALGTVGGPLAVEGAAGLRALSLPALRATGGLRLEENDALETLSAPALATCDGPLVVRGQAALRDLDALALEGALGGALQVEDNVQLAGLGGLFGLEAVAGAFVVTGNPALATAEISALLSAIGVPDVAGPVTVAGNGP